MTVVFEWLWIAHACQHIEEFFLNKNSQTSQTSVPFIWIQ